MDTPDRRPSLIYQPTTPAPVQRRRHRPQRGDQGHQRRLALSVWRFGVRRSAFNGWPFAVSSSPRVKFLTKLNDFRNCYEYHISTNYNNYSQIAEPSRPYPPTSNRRTPNAERQTRITLPLTVLLPSRDPIPNLGSGPVPGAGWSESLCLL